MNKVVCVIELQFKRLFVSRASVFQYGGTNEEQLAELVKLNPLMSSTRPLCPVPCVIVRQHVIDR